ncbi:MAG TPA: inositol monophosphatase [Planctomycetes bacterium]|nr:inositol monophosphatase [Planctomycetota bacterium]
MSDFFTTCERAVRAAGEVLLEKWGRVTAREKGRFDLVTEADLAAQEVVRRTVLEAFPDHAVLGEEDSIEKQKTCADRPYRWIVDPLDGTTNFVHGVPHFSVSLALEHEGELLVGAVFNPLSGELFSAVRGDGANLNGESIRTSGVVSLGEALGAVGFPPVVTDESPDFRLFVRAVKECQSIRRMGSVALNLSYLAAGRLDVAWSFSAKTWDVAAGVLLISEAGGVVTAPDGGPVDLDRPGLIAAATADLHEAIRRLAAAEGLTGETNPTT